MSHLGLLRRLLKKQRMSGDYGVSSTVGMVGPYGGAMVGKRSREEDGTGRKNMFSTDETPLSPLLLRAGPP